MSENSEALNELERINDKWCVYFPDEIKAVFDLAAEPAKTAISSHFAQLVESGRQKDIAMTEMREIAQELFKSSRFAFMIGLDCGNRISRMDESNHDDDVDFLLNFMDWTLITSSLLAVKSFIERKKEIAGIDLALDEEEMCGRLESLFNRTMKQGIGFSNGMNQPQMDALQSKIHAQDAELMAIIQSINATMQTYYHDIFSGS